MLQHGSAEAPFPPHHTSPPPKHNRASSSSFFFFFYKTVQPLSLHSSTRHSKLVSRTGFSIKEGLSAHNSCDPVSCNPKPASKTTLKFGFITRMNGVTNRSVHTHIYSWAKRARPSTELPSLLSKLQETLPKARSLPFLSRGGTYELPA